MDEKWGLYDFSVYRSDIHGGEGGYVAEERYHTIAEVLAHPFRAGEEYWIDLHNLRRWMRKKEFEEWASKQVRK